MVVLVPSGVAGADTATTALFQNAQGATAHWSTSSWPHVQPCGAGVPQPEPAHWVPTRGPHIRGTTETAQSTNWAGIIDSGTQFTGVGGDWTVPTVQPSAGSESSSTWIGIDGALNSSLIQTGTDQGSSGSGTTDFAWYEVLPNPAVVIGLVSPGDQMQASIVETSPGTWTLSIADLTSAQSVSGPLSYSGPGTSAEWIEEDPFVNGQQPPLANFGSATFSNMEVTSPNISTTALSAVEMIDSADNVIAYPGNVVNNSFTVTYGSPPPPPPPPPPTPPPPPPPPPTPAPTPPVANGNLPAPVVGIASFPDGSGYWLANAEGAVSAHGDAFNCGSMAGQSLNAAIAHIVATPDGKGYWLVASDGGTFAFGDAGFYGSMGGQHLNAPVVDIAPTPDGKGYWLVASDGGIFAFGDAQFHGSMGGQQLNRPVVGIAVDNQTGGYWEVATDGGIFAFGAPFFGSTGAITLNKPVNGMTATASDQGYWFVASDGGIFAFGNSQFYGSMGGSSLNAPVVGMATDNTTGGYWLVGADGGIFSFAAPFYGAD